MLDALISDSLFAMPILGWAFLGTLILIVQILNSNPRLSFVVTLLGLITLLGVSLVHYNPEMNREVFFGSAVMDSLTQLVNFITLGTVFGVVLMMFPGYFRTTKVFKSSFPQLPEFLCCLVFSAFGVVVLASAVDLTATFLGLETLSIALYCLCGFYRSDVQSTESAFKYLLIGAFATVIFLYGVAFLYGATGSTQYSAIAQAIQLGPRPLVLLAGIFLVAGFGFKLALVPFHIYTPDVYEGAPTPVTAYLATIVKVAAIAGALRLFWGVFGSMPQVWEPYWLGLCILSILIGNIAALQQRSIKKLLAFSSIAHAGFIGLGLLIAQGESGSLFPLFAYLVIYVSMTLGIFALLTWVEDREETIMLDDLKGLHERHGGIAILFAIFIFGLAGVPPFAGFMAKFWILQGLIEQEYFVAAVFGVIGSLIGAAYYLKVLVYIFMCPASERQPIWSVAVDRLYSLRLLLAITLLITIFAGLRPQWTPLRGLEFLVSRDKMVMLDRRF